MSQERTGLLNVLFVGERSGGYLGGCCMHREASAEVQASLLRVSCFVACLLGSGPLSQHLSGAAPPAAAPCALM